MVITLAARLLAFLIVFSSVVQIESQKLDLQNVDISEILIPDEAQINQFPHQVSLQIGIDDNLHHFCSGAILSSEWVTSTAYCVTSTERTIMVVAGLYFRNESHLDVQTSEVSIIVVHPYYSSGLPKNDIALLKLKIFLWYTKSVQPIMLLEEDVQDISGAAVLSSWTVQTRLSKELPLYVLHYMIVFLLSDSECSYAVGNLGFDEKQLCSEKTPQAIFCPGESGSPLIYNGYLIGLTSWGTSPCGITVFTKMQSFMDFIKAHVDI